MGFKILATKGTCIEFIKNNVPTEFVLKVAEGRPNIIDLIINKKVDLVINSAIGSQAVADSFPIRRTALEKQIPYVTTIRGADAVANAIDKLRKAKIDVKPIQLFYRSKESAK